MSQNFRATVEHSSAATRVALIGVIDEDNGLADLLAQIPPLPLLVDLSEITRINSPGVRDWISWIARLEQQGIPLSFAGCTPPMVSQINLVSNFTGNGVILSLYLPYFCPKCDDDKRVLVEAEHLEPPPADPPLQRCEECDGIMDFDELPGSYLSFLKDPRKLGRGSKISMAAVAPSPRMSGLPGPADRTAVLPSNGAAPPPAADPAPPIVSAPPTRAKVPTQPNPLHQTNPGPAGTNPGPAALGLSPPGSYAINSTPAPPPGPASAPALQPYTPPRAKPPTEPPYQPPVEPLAAPPEPVRVPSQPLPHTVAPIPDLPRRADAGAGLQLVLMIALVAGIGVLGYLIFAG
jgi:hypothetical protein